MLDITTLVRTNIQNLKAYSSARDEYSGREGIFLDANENPFGDLNRYPDPYQIELKKSISEKRGLQLDQIFVGNGSDEVLDLLLRIFCTPGSDKALCFTPSYGMIEVSAAINDVELVRLPLNENFEIDLKQTFKQAKFQRVKIIYICSPNNPTGNLIPQRTIEELLSKSNAIVVIDEAYIEFSSQDSLIKLIDTYPNLVISQTLSKAFGLAGARIGFAFAQQEIITLLNKVKPPYNVSELNQRAALQILEQEGNFQKNRSTILKQRKILREALEQNELVSRVFPSEANFLLVQFTDSKEVFEYLLKRKIITRNRATQVENCLRISVGSPEENKLLITQLKALENEKSTVY